MDTNIYIRIYMCVCVGKSSFTQHTVLIYMLLLNRLFLPTSSSLIFNV